MQITVFTNSAQMTAHCKMLWMGKIEYKVVFFQTCLNTNEKIAAYLIFSKEEPISIPDKERSIYELWEKNNKEKAGELKMMFGKTIL